MTPSDEERSADAGGHGSSQRPDHRRISRRSIDDVEAPSCSHTREPAGDGRWERHHLRLLGQAGRKNSAEAEDVYLVPEASVLICEAQRHPRGPRVGVKIMMDREQDPHQVVAHG